MKSKILDHMKVDRLYSREELAAYTGRIDHDLAALLSLGKIKKHYQGIYSLSEYKLNIENLISKITNKLDFIQINKLIIDTHKYKIIDAKESKYDYIVLNKKRTDSIELHNYKIKFKIPSHDFPEKLNEDFLLIYNLNHSSNKDMYLSRSNSLIDKSFIKKNAKFATQGSLKALINYSELSKSTSDVSLELAQLGAPIFTNDKITRKKSKINIEDIISRALEVGMKDPRIHNVIPYTIYKNSSKIDFRKLGDYSHKNGTARYLGYILDLLGKIGYGESISKLDAPRYHRQKPIVLFESSFSKRTLNLMNKESLSFAREKWGIIIKTTLESEKQKIEKWL